MVLAALRGRWQVTGDRKVCGGRLYDARPPAPEGQVRRVWLFEPHTYMNRSGEAVKGLLEYHEADCCDMLIVLDDMALPMGRIRARASGSAGGHNGLKDVLRLLGTEDVPRLRIGIGSPPAYLDSVDYVLGRFEDNELEVIRPAVDQAADAVDDWIASDIQSVMDKYNRKPDAEEA